MKRRTFAKLAAAPLALTDKRVGSKLFARQTGSDSIKLGNQHWSDDVSLKVLAALGVNHICSAEPSMKFDENCQWKD